MEEGRRGNESMALYLSGGTSFGGCATTFAPAEPGALWTLGSVSHDSTGKRREVYSAPGIGVASERGS